MSALALRRYPDLHITQVFANAVVQGSQRIFESIRFQYGLDPAFRRVEGMRRGVLYVNVQGISFPERTGSTGKTPELNCRAGSPRRHTRRTAATTLWHSLSPKAIRRTRRPRSSQCGAAKNRRQAPLEGRALRVRLRCSNAPWANTSQ